MNFDNVKEPNYKPGYGPEPVFVDDRRKDNPALHLLYVKTACGHLALIDQILKDLDSTSNINMTNMLMAVMDQRKKLIMENAAYWDAVEIYDLVKNGGHPIPEED